MTYYTKSIDQLLKQLETSETGLSTIQAREKQERYGLNEVTVKGVPLWKKIIEPFASIFMLVLFIASFVSFLQGKIFDGVVVVVIIISTAIISYVQQISTEKILRSLQKKNSISVGVMRDNHYHTMDASQLVPGDIIMLNEGDKIPADARIMTCESFRVDESQLTGESSPILKQTEKLETGKELYERTNSLFQGSFVISGQATAIVTTTGNNTEFGQIAVLSTDGNSESPVRKKIDRLVNQIIIVIGAIATVAFLLSLYRGADIGESIRFVLALTVSAVPESLPVSISVVLALGMRRMATKKALIRTMRSIENIGVVTTIATDKTGTLTKNKLSVFNTWITTGSLAEFKRKLALSSNGIIGKTFDPLDIAVNDYTDISYTHRPQKTLPFDTKLSLSGNLWKDGDSFNLYLKGSPESIISISNMDNETKLEAESELQKMSSRGYRVIGLAHKNNVVEISNLIDIDRVGKLEFDGFIAVADELRPEAISAIKRASSAGIVVRMITGDHFETAYHIGRDLGIVNSRDQVFDSRLMNGMSDDELEAIIDKTRVFSRVIPENKHRILTLLKRKNITAMTGDGVNDVPAITNAHIGISMGSGTNIAKDASDIILLDDNFKSIIDAVHEGRTIYANIKRMLLYLLSTNAGEVIVSVGALIAGLPLPLAPVQILWVNLATDSLTVIPLGLEPGEKRNMKHKPQDPNSPILSKFMITRVIIIAISMGIMTLGIYIHFLGTDGEDYARTLAFNALVVMQWASTLCARSDYESIFTRMKRWSTPMFFGLSSAIVLQFMAMFGPLGKYLHVSVVSIGDIFAVSFFVFVTQIAVIETHKLLGRIFFNKGSRPLPIFKNI